jgi:hypothetical protein
MFSDDYGTDKGVGFQSGAKSGVGVGVGDLGTILWMWDLAVEEGRWGRRRDVLDDKKQKVVGSSRIRKTSSKLLHLKTS